YSVSLLPSNATSIQWTVPAAALSFTGQGTTSISVSYPATAVSGNVTATAVSNCGSSTTRVTMVSLPACEVAPPPPPFAKAGTGIITPAAGMQVMVFPNPTVADFKVQVLTAGAAKITVRILDVQGRALKSYTVLPNQTSGIGSDLKTGAYMMEVRQGNEVKVTRVLKF
ncbi:MAG: T9SS type A sorting domain-containing protein, partial [Ferruginibacter sp.]|nr:T9SS type A sorting domain-containing protein [Ferruginibacter sp.]